MIHALHDPPPRKDGLNRFIIVSLGRGQRYVQCRFVEGDAGALCEASSGAYGPTDVNRMVLTANQRGALSKLGFGRKSGSKNYVREFSVASRADIEGLGFFMVQTLRGVYGLGLAEKFVIQSSLDSRAAISRACPETLQFFGGLTAGPR
ncbi:MAG: TY-Chap domain-containing protein [Methylocystis sp.]